MKKLILFTSPIVLWLLCLLLPTVDDWSYYTFPYVGGFPFMRLLPYGSYWRPFDHIMGWICGLDCRIFPTLNHILVYGAHLANTLLLWRIARQLRFTPFGQNIAGAFFYFSPAMLGTVTGIDSLNQAYAVLWGLIALTIALADKPKEKHGTLKATAIILCIVIATLCKENGYMWAIVIPIIAYSFRFINRKTFLRHLLVAMAMGILYAVVRLLLTFDQVEVNHDYIDVSLLTRLKDLGTFIALTWFPIDFAAIAYPPERNLWLAAILLLIGLPFILYVCFAKPKKLLALPHVALIVCTILAALPHLITLFTTMHNYAGLSMAALAIAWLTDQIQNKKAIQLLFGCWIFSVVIIDIHHGIEAYKSGMLGKRMAIETIEKTRQPANRVSIIFIDTNEPRYSSFCVIPYDAFGWGTAVILETGMQWPKDFEYHEIKKQQNANAMETATSIARHDIDHNRCECAWIVEKDNITVVR